MFKNISFGVYYPGHSLLHRLQARTKLLLLGWFTVFVTIANHHTWKFAPYIVLAISVLLGTALAGISFNHMWGRMKLLLLLSLLAAIPTIFSRNDNSLPLYALGPVHVAFAAIRWAILIYGVVLTVYIILSLLPLPAVRSFLHRPGSKRTRITFVVLTLLALAILWLIRNYPPGATFPAGPFVITNTGTWALMSLFTVFLSLYAFSVILTTTTAPIALIEGLTMLLKPLRWLRLPVDEFALMALIALRFFPTLFEELEQLLKAQTSRGADYAHGSLRERVQSVVSLFVPMMQGILRRAADLSVALEARGYQIEGKQTYLHETSFKTLDYTVLAVVIVVTVGALLV
jgi:energy-coupling factor transport system permease protein